MGTLFGRRVTEEDVNSLSWWKANAPGMADYILKDGNGLPSEWCIIRVGYVYSVKSNAAFCRSYDLLGSYEELKGHLIQKPKEKKGMKGSDKVMVELTGYQVAKLYAVMGHTNGPDLCNSWFKFQELLGDSIQEIHNKHFRGKKYEDVRNYANYREEWESVILEPETPLLTEAQKKALELKETIAKAQKQLEGLEKEIA